MRLIPESEFSDEFLLVSIKSDPFPSFFSSNKKYSLAQLSKMLRFAMNRILTDSHVSIQKKRKDTLTGNQELFLNQNSILQYIQFNHSADKVKYPDFDDFIINPINLNNIDEKISANKFLSTEAFVSDIKWILHNCNIYFSRKSMQDLVFLNTKLKRSG